MTTRDPSGSSAAAGHAHEGSGVAHEAVSAVPAALMKYARLERERRWLVRSLPGGVTRVDDVVDRYIPRTRLRLREVTSTDDGSRSRKLGHKVRLDEAREIACTSIYLDDEEWEALRVLPGRTLRKRRHHVLRDGMRVAVDQHADGTLVAEIDGGSSPAPAAPPWLDVIREVTADEEWTGAGLVAARTPRLRHGHGRLRRWRRDDAPYVLAALRDDPSLQRQLPPIQSLADAEVYCTERGEGRHRMAICVDDRPVGNVGLRVRSRRRCGWCSYWLAPDARGQGLATQALASISSWAFDDLGLYRLELAHRLDNAASGQVAERAGFAVEGILRGELEYDGIRYDTRLLSRLATDPDPGVPHLPIAF